MILAGLGPLRLSNGLKPRSTPCNRLERFRGHFYNWYATRDLRPLDPKYVSTVDSGNLAGHLLALGQACKDIIDRPVVGPHLLSGIADAVLLVREAAHAILDGRRTQTVTRKHLDETLDALTEALSSVPVTPKDWGMRCAALEVHAHTLVDIARTLTAERGEGAETEILTWADAVRIAIESHARDLDALMPWARRLAGDDLSPELLTPESAPAWPALARLGVSLPSLADMADHCEAALRDLTTLRARVAAEGVTQSEDSYSY